MTTLEKIRAKIQKVLDTERDFTSENAKAQALALNWVLELFDKYAEQEPCDDAISRDSVQKEINCWIGSGEYRYAMSERFLLDRIKGIPSVRPQEQTGHWINHILSIECSCCGNKLFADDENENCEDYDAIDDLGYKFCPNCGARMVEPQETETWHGIHAQITAPKGTFERIFNEADDDNDI